MTQVPGEPEVVLPEGRRWDLDGDGPSRMVHEPEIVEPEKTQAEETEAEEPAAAPERHAETAVQEPEIVVSEQEE